MRKAYFDLVKSMAASGDRNHCIWKWRDPYGDYPDRYFVCDSYRILELAEPVEGIPVKETEKNQGIPDLCVRYMKEAYQGDKTICTLPSVEQVKDGIRAIRGMKYSVPVAVRYNENRAAYNASYILDGMNALKATTFYSEEGNPRSPAWMFHLDDFGATIKYMVLPVMSNGNMGYFSIPEK